MTDSVQLQGMIPGRLKVKSSKIMLDSLEVETDIGFHGIGNRDSLLGTCLTGAMCALCPESGGFQRTSGSTRP